jgi:uncharacterized protein YneF (UPF0154 family)
MTWGVLIIAIPIAFSLGTVFGAFWATRRIGVQ